MAFGIENLFGASFSQGAQASSAQASAATPATATSTPATAPAKAEDAASLGNQKSGAPPMRVKPASITIAANTDARPGQRNSTTGKVLSPGDPTFTAAQPEWLPAAPRGATQIGAAQAGIRAVGLNPSELQPRDRIELWLGKNPRPSVANIIAGLEELSKDKPLSEKDQLFLIGRAFPTSSVLVAPDELANALKDKPELRGVFTKWLLSRAVERESKTTSENSNTRGSPHSQAGLFTLAALKVMQGHDAELGALITDEKKMLPKEGEYLASTLGDQNQLYYKSSVLVDARHQFLSALNSVPRTDTTRAVVQKLYLQITPNDITPRSLAV